MNNMNNDNSREALRRAAEMAGPEPVTPDRVEVTPVCQPTLEGNERKYVMQCTVDYVIMLLAAVKFHLGSKNLPCFVRVGNFSCFEGRGYWNICE